MGAKPSSKQAKMRKTIIPFNNPLPKPGKPEYQGKEQSMVFKDGPLKGEVKGMLQVLRKQTSIWDKVCKLTSKKPIGTCKVCNMSQKKKATLARIAEAEEVGNEDEAIEKDFQDAEEPIQESSSD
ncbi:hypothetical protein ACEPAF_393 [Sanghuangporus sanghuang]